MEMTSRSTARSSTDVVVEGVSGALVGVGTLILALFPLALPLIALTLIAALPLVVLALAVGLLTAPVAIPVLLVRRLRRRADRAATARPATPPRPAVGAAAH
jgi:hypothetical protein